MTPFFNSPAYCREFLRNFRVHDDAIPPFPKQSTPFHLEFMHFRVNSRIPPIAAPTVITVRPRTLFAATCRLSPAADQQPHVPALT